jgi:hypothetical protein
MHIRSSLSNFSVLPRFQGSQAQDNENEEYGFVREAMMPMLSTGGSLESQDPQDSLQLGQSLDMPKDQPKPESQPAPKKAKHDHEASSQKAWQHPRQKYEPWVSSLLSHSFTPEDVVELSVHSPRAQVIHKQGFQEYPNLTSVLKDNHLAHLLEFHHVKPQDLDALDSTDDDSRKSFVRRYYEKSLKK